MISSRILFCLFIMALMPACARHSSIAHDRACHDRACIAPIAARPMMIAPPKPVKPVKPLIMIDPGHGGKDLGAVSLSKPTYQEKNLNLSTARLLEQYLKHRGYPVVMTRSDDSFPSLEERAELVKEKKAKLFVSVHYNSAPNPTADGIEVFYYKSDKEIERTKKSEALAKAVLDKVIEGTQARSRGVKHGNYSVIRNNSVPAILIEGGFMTNEKELEHLKDPLYLKKLAWGIAQGIDNYFQQQAK